MRDCGYGFDAVMTLCCFLFNEMNFYRVECKILDYNQSSEKLYEKCGFILEGRLRETLWKDGKWRDQLAYVLLRTDWLRNTKGKLS